MAHLLRHGSRMSWRSSTQRSVKLRRGLLLAPLIEHLPPEESGAERHVRVSPLLSRSEERLGDLGPASGRWTQLPKRRPLAPGVDAGAGGRRRSLRCVVSTARISAPPSSDSVSCAERRNRSRTKRPSTLHPGPTSWVPCRLVPWSS